MECVLLILDIPYIFVRDVATAPKPWGCLNLEKLSIYIAKESEDEAEWEGRVFDQISKLQRLLSLDLKQDPYFCGDDDEYDDRVQPHALETLDFRLSSRPKEPSSSGNNDRSANVRRWSSLVQLQKFVFDGKRQMLGMEEVLWMTEHWRDLTLVSGRFMDVEDEGKLMQLFAEKGVFYWN